jgi:hypothetical protein
MNHGGGINRALEGEAAKLVVKIEKPQNVLARAVGGSKFQGRPDLLPRIRNTRLESEPGLVEIPEINSPGGQEGLRPEGCEFGVRAPKLLLVA